MQEHETTATRTTHSFHLICSNAGLLAISEFTALRSAGISSLKIYMTYEALQLKDSEILDVLFEAGRQKIVTMIHAETEQSPTGQSRNLKRRNYLILSIMSRVILLWLRLRLRIGPLV
jgi:hypothetical protein